MKLHIISVHKFMLIIDVLMCYVCFNDVMPLKVSSGISASLNVLVTHSKIQI